VSTHARQASLPFRRNLPPIRFQVILVSFSNWGTMNHTLDNYTVHDHICIYGCRGGSCFGRRVKAVARETVGEICVVVGVGTACLSALKRGGDNSKGVGEVAGK
jgi:hypothetical protein